MVRKEKAERQAKLKAIDVEISVMRSNASKGIEQLTVYNDYKGFLDILANQDASPED